MLPSPTSRIAPVDSMATRSFAGLAVMPVHRAFCLSSVTMIDPTEGARRALVAEINCQAAERAALEARYGQVWNTSEVANDFEVLEFAAPFAVVKRKADSKMGSLMFQHHPRCFMPHPVLCRTVGDLPRFSGRTARPMRHKLGH